MRRSRRNKRNINSKLGLLFIILILFLASISASYAHWEGILKIEGELETTEWEEKTIDPFIAFEDLEIVIGTGTQGYWKTHPEAWPVDEITIGVITYSKCDAIDIMEESGHGDKTYDMFQQLVAAKLNVLIGCTSYCIDQTIINADAWMAQYPVGSGVGGGSQAWQTGGPLHDMLTDYNEGELCAPHRDDVEDLNDYDYNDFVVEADVTGTYVQEYLVMLNFTFEAMARGAAYHHDLNFYLPSGLFGTGGEYEITYYEKDGTEISSSTSTFTETDPINIIIFSNTWTALPPTAGHAWAANTIDGTGVYPGRITKITFTFEGFFCDTLNLETYTLDYIGTHGGNLFFDIYLHVWNTGENINKGDSRFIVTPNTWIWPEETAPIWTVYPYNGGTGEGVHEGTPPIFTQHWYTETPTTYRWDPV